MGKGIAVAAGVAAGVAAVIAAAAGCGAEQDGQGGAVGEAPSATSPSPSPQAPPRGSTEVEVRWQTDSSYLDPGYAAFEVDLSLGEPFNDPMGVCGMVPEEGMVAVPVTLTLVNTDDESDPDVVHTGPQALEATAVGGAGPLMWSDPKDMGGQSSCEEDFEVESLVNDWSHRESRTIRGELLVAEDTPAGAGVELEFTSDYWEEWEGTADPLTVTY